MRLWGQQINQWNAWQRCALLFGILLVWYSVWYLMLEKPILKKYRMMVAQQTQAQAALQELRNLLQLKNNFIYRNNLQYVPLKQVFQGALSAVSGVDIVHFDNNSIIALPAGASQFSHINTILGISLLNIIPQSPATITFTGTFNAFAAYLQILQQNGRSIYFDNINFDMNRYPQAKITMKVFTLGE